MMPSVLRFSFFLCCLWIIPIYASVYEYAKTQNNDISPDIMCDGNNYEATCSVKNIEWIDGVMVQDFQYKALLQDDIFTQIKSYELKTNNLNFEGYNITALVPSLLMCKTTSQYKPFHNKNAITTTIVCQLQSNIYNIEVKAKFNTTHPMYQQSHDILTLLDAERQRLIKPIHTSQDDTWKKDYLIYLNSVNISIKSHSLNAVIFDLYKREQRIADNKDSENDKDYLTLNNTKAQDDYYRFLQNIYGIYNTLVTNYSLSKTNVQSLKHLFDTLISIATLPNKNLTVSLKGGKDSVISLLELENITDINESILKSIAKILQNTQLSIQE